MPTLRIRQSCASFAAKLSKTKSAASQEPQYQRPVPGVRRLFLGAWKTSRTDKTGRHLEYNLGFLLTDPSPASSQTKAEGFGAIHAAIGPSYSITRDDILAGAVYLGQVPNRVSINDIKSYAKKDMTNCVKLETPDDIGNFISALLQDQRLYPYVPKLTDDDLKHIAAALKVYCDCNVIEYHDEKPTGRFKQADKFFNSPLPILDLRGELLTDPAFHAIPKYTPR